MFVRVLRTRRDCKLATYSSTTQAFESWPCFGFVSRLTRGDIIVGLLYRSVDTFPQRHFCRALADGGFVYSIQLYSIGCDICH